MTSLPGRLILFLNLVWLSQQRLEDTNVQVVHSWKFPDWWYPSDELKQTAEEQGQLVPPNAAILDSDFYFAHSTSLRRIFVSTPQFRSGIPATLSEVTRLHRNGSFVLRPFPDWDAHNRTNCSNLISVSRFHIDKCGVLWALDSGLIDQFTSKSRALCQPKLVLYDLNNKDAMILRYEFPYGVITYRSNLANIITETYQNDCHDSIAYIADTDAYGLVVFDLARKNSWRIQNPHFYPFPSHGAITSNNVSFELTHGILAITLSPQHDADRKLYFHSFTSAREAYIPVQLLKNASLASNRNELRKQTTVLGEGKSSQSTLQVMTEDGILLYALLERNAIVCWNSRTKFGPENQYIIYEDDENLQFVSGMKLKGNQLLLTSSRLQNYMNDDLMREDVKYRMILIDDVHQLLVNSPCTGEEQAITDSPDAHLKLLNSSASADVGDIVTTSPVTDSVTKLNPPATPDHVQAGNSSRSVPPTLVEWI